MVVGISSEYIRDRVKGRIWVLLVLVSELQKVSCENSLHFALLIGRLWVEDVEKVVNLENYIVGG